MPVRTQAPYSGGLANRRYFRSLIAGMEPDALLQVAKLFANDLHVRAGEPEPGCGFHDLRIRVFSEGNVPFEGVAPDDAGVRLEEGQMHLVAPRHVLFESHWRQGQGIVGETCAESPAPKADSALGGGHFLPCCALNGHKPTGTSSCAEKANA